MYVVDDSAPEDPKPRTDDFVGSHAKLAWYSRVCLDISPGFLGAHAGPGPTAEADTIQMGEWTTTTLMSYRFGVDDRLMFHVSELTCGRPQCQSPP